MLLATSLLAIFLENTIRRDLVGGMSQVIMTIAHLVVVEHAWENYHSINWEET